MDGTPPRRSKAWLPCGCAVLLLLMLLASPALVFLIWNRDKANQIERRLAKIREAGQPTSYIELEEFYRLPVGATDTTQLWLDGMQFLVDNPFPPSVKPLPFVGEGKTVRPGEPWPDIEAAESLLKQYAVPLEKFHAAARLGGHARYPVDFSQGYNAKLDHVQNLRAAARLLHLEAYVRGHRGDAPGCTESIRTLFAIRRSLEREPIFVSNLVSIALHGIALNALADTMTTVKFPDNELRSFQTELRSVPHREIMQRAVMGERVFGCEAFHNPDQVEIEGQPINFPFLNSDFALYLEIFDDVLAATDEDFPKCLGSGVAALHKIHGVVGSPVQKIGHIYTALLTPAFSAFLDASARNVSASRLGDAAIGIELYRRKHGRLPPSLAELVPEFLPQIPIDPYNGQPLRFVTRPDGFAVYSIGRDGKDDGGKDQEPPLDDVMFVPLPPGRN